MKTNVKLFVFILILCLFLPRSSARGESPFADSDAVISMDFQGASLKDILKILSIQSGLNFIAAENVQDRQITLYLDKVPVREVMDTLFKANNLTYVFNEDANIFIVRDWGKPKIETITKVFPLKYATVSNSSLNSEKDQISSSGSSGSSGSQAASSSGAGKGITDAVTKMLSEEGSVIEDNRTNSLIVTDIPQNIPIIGQFIASLDIPTPQVMLEVEMLDVSKKLVDRLGFNFGSAGSAVTPFTLIFPGSLAHGSFFIGRKDNINKEGVVPSVIHMHRC